MSHPGRIPALVGDERGAVLVIFAVFAPVAILFAVFAIDTGNWYLHKRHLQLQADAGALAAALEFQPCSNSAIEAAAQKYSGIAGSPLYNEQLGGIATSNVHELINSKRYFNSPSNPAPEDASAEEKPPCEADMVDVKLTETNLPWYWHPLSSVGYINAHARVEILQKATAKGAAPISVNENAPRAARAYFINETNGNVVAEAPLTARGPNNFGEEVWNNNGAALAVPINVTNETNKQKVANIGVRIALSGDANNTTCPSNSKLVNCFDSSSTTTTLAHVQGWSNLPSGSPTEPKAHSVTLSAGTCSDGYFSTTTTTCAIGVQAHLDVGSTPNPAGLTVSAEVEGGSASPLTYNTSGVYSGQWTGSTALAPGSGSKEVKLKVTCTKNVTPSCGTTTTTTIGVQRTYQAGPNSGSIGSAGISQEEPNGSLVSGANSFQVCETAHTSCSPKLVVNVTTTGSLANAQKYSDPLYVMRFGGGTSASQTGAIQCPPGGQGGFREDLEMGCSGTYAPNPQGPGWKCPDGATPQDCVETDNGLKTGQLKQGLTKRITEPVNGTRYYPCNNWVKNNGEGAPRIPSDDSRIATVFVTSYGSFGGSGATWYPIQTFATFYITGWDGDPNTCTNPKDDAAGKDQVVGHFIKYVTLDTGGGGTGKCELNAFGQCVAVLTR